MKCIFNIRGAISEGERSYWKRMTDNDTLPDLYELDLDSVPCQGDKFEFNSSYGYKVVSLVGKIKDRRLCDDRNNGIERGKGLYYWITLSNVEVYCWDINPEDI